ncbi:MAG: hypothetical protein ACE5HW_07255, partial [Candidatus Methanofastidiosia archaeon]
MRKIIGLALLTCLAFTIAVLAEPPTPPGPGGGGGGGGGTTPQPSGGGTTPVPGSVSGISLSSDDSASL